MQCSIIEPSRVLSYLRRRERRMEEGYRDEDVERKETERRMSMERGDREEDEDVERRQRGV